MVSFYAHLFPQTWEKGTHKTFQEKVSASCKPLAWPPYSRSRQEGALLPLVPVTWRGSSDSKEILDLQVKSECSDRLQEVSIIHHTYMYVCVCVALL